MKGIISQPDRRCIGSPTEVVPVLVCPYRCDPRRDRRLPCTFCALPPCPPPVAGLTIPASKGVMMKKDPEPKHCRCQKGVRDPDEVPGGGMTRRDFLKTAGMGTVAVAAAGQLAPETAAAQEELRPEELARITLTINGRRHRLLVEPRWSLLFVLREKLGLTGTKVGCERGECGACTVLIDDLPRYACLTLAVEAEGHAVTTLEGLLDGEELGPVQQAFLEEDGYQCGYCTPGQIMAVEGLLRAQSAPDLAEIRRGVSGNLCRCGAYPNIFRAVQRAAELKRGRGGEP
jgi:xanthine dehydrogenase YagT iron-sulfur-binding subunit